MSKAQIIMKDKTEKSHAFEGAESQGPPEDIEKWELARSVLKSAVVDLGIKDIAEYGGEPLKLRWHLFYKEFPNDIILKMLVQGLFGTIHADMSLILAAKWVVDEVERVLSQPDANRVLDFAEEERPDVLRENARMILMGLINQIPVVTFHNLSEALRDSVQSHIKTYVEPLLKEHWQSLGLAKDYTVSPSDEFTAALQGVDEQFRMLREQLRGNKRARLTDEKRANLADEHEQLRIAYEGAKTYYNQAQRAFFSGKRNRTVDEWKEEWGASSLRMFPELFYRCLNEIDSYQPFQLAHMHLAEFYGYSPDYMVKLVSQSRPRSNRTSS
ncbi:MAG TPA: hypothetical protein VHE60_10610 [Pyrinomonadaceae bacterium]|nr:hypothetical protein [Pyrinomonadaceae bacterium]